MPTPTEIRELMLAFMDMKHIVDCVLPETPLNLVPRYQSGIEKYARFKALYGDV